MLCRLQGTRVKSLRTARGLRRHNSQLPEKPLLGSGAVCGGADASGARRSEERPLREVADRLYGFNEIEQQSRPALETAPIQTSGKPAVVQLTILGFITATPIALPAAVSLPNMASSSYVPTIAPPEPAKFAVAPTARAMCTISRLPGSM